MKNGEQSDKWSQNTTDRLANLIVFIVMKFVF